jgi:hypothetical protein
MLNFTPAHASNSMSKTDHAIQRLLYSLLSLPALFLFTGTAAAEETRYAFMLQNDIFAGSDGGGYTNGIALSQIRSVSRGEDAVEPQWLLAPVTALFGLGPATLTLSSINQLMVTPADITRKVPDPADSPYLGALSYRAAQVSVRGEIADMLAFNIGMIGPASGARQTQTLFHRITNSDKPEGWDYQVRKRALIGIDAIAPTASRLATWETNILQAT